MFDAPPPTLNSNDDDTADDNDLDETASRRSRRSALVGAGAALLATACTPKPTASKTAALPAPAPAPPTLPAPAPAPGPPASTAPPATSAPSTTAPTTAPATTAPTSTPGGGAGGGSAALSAALVIDKLTFGPKPGLRAAIEARGVNGWIEDQLNPVGSGVPDAEQRIAGYITLTNSNYSNYHLRMQPNAEERFFAELDYATIQRAVYSERQLYELMVDFWANHFNIWRNKNWATHLMSRSHETVIRPHALGRFADMLVASAHDPAMSNYLDNISNSGREGINENYARELMELHTLGIHNGTQVYTEADVVSVAKLLSGWNVYWDPAQENLHTYRFDWWNHDHSALSILGGAWSRPKRTANGANWSSDGDLFLAFLATHPSTAKHLSRKLCRRFIGDTPSESLVESAAAVYLAHDTNIAAVLRHIFASAEFAASARGKVRRPIEHLYAVLRATGAQLPTEAQSVTAGAIRGALQLMGQPLYERVSPDGYPDQGAFWLNSEAMLKRWQAAGAVCANSLTNQSNGTDRLRVDLSSLAGYSGAATVGALISWIASQIANFDMPPGDVASLCNNAGVSSSAPASSVIYDPARLAMAFALVFSHPTFQRR